MCVFVLNSGAECHRGADARPYYNLGVLWYDTQANRLLFTYLTKKKMLILHLYQPYFFTYLNDIIDIYEHGRSFINIYEQWIEEEVNGLQVMYQKNTGGVFVFSNGLHPRCYENCEETTPS